MMKKTLSILAFSALPIVALAAGNHAGDAHTPTGQPGDPAKVTRTIEVTMDDTMRFTPNEIAVKAGETVRFFIRNKGKIAHEMVIGSIADLEAHAAEMRKTPNMKHAEPNMITLGPGKIGGLVWRFDQRGTVNFACLVPGHLEAGMVGKVKVD